jgi:hypothetical protein
MRGSFGRELGAGTQPGPFAERSEPLLDKPLAGPFNGRHARAHSLRTLLSGQLLVRFQQKPGARQFAATGFPPAAQPSQFIAFRRWQIALGLFPRFLSLRVSRFPSTCPLSTFTPQIQCD